MASSSDSSNKIYTLNDVQKLTEDKSKCVLVIGNHVYDVTKFLDEHPGGEEVLKEQNGKDATDAFEDVGHSSDAREQMKAYEIGRLDSSDVKRGYKASTASANTNGNSTGNREDTSAAWTKWIIPIVIAVAAVVLFKLLAKPGLDAKLPPKAI